MKALTVQQPWAWAIIHADKIENRSWATRHRGPLAIHAGATVSRQGKDDLVVRTAFGDAMRRDEPHDLHLGSIIGVVDLVDVHEATTDCVDGECDPWGWFCWEDDLDKPVYHWVFRNPRPLDEPIPCRGALGLWTPDPDVLRHLEAVAA